MKKQVLVIGLGQFGMSVARALSRRGLDVLAADRNPHLVQEASAFAAQAVVFDASIEEDLARTEPARRDVAICAIGDESREASILCTALLRQMGAPRVVARASDPLHERILRLVGAHEVLNPERDFGERLAARLAFTDLVAEVPLGGDLVVSEVRLPRTLAGQSLADLQLPRRFGLTVVAVRKVAATAEGGGISMPQPAEPLEEGDILLLVGRTGAAEELLRRV